MDEFYEQPTVQSFFPLVFGDGARWETFTGRCGTCDGALGEGELRGTVTRPFGSVFIIDAWGYCGGCRRLTPFKYRMHEDMGMTGQYPGTGDWVRWEPRRGWSLRRWLRGLLTW